MLRVSNLPPLALHIQEVTIPPHFPTSLVNPGSATAVRSNLFVKWLCSPLDCPENSFWQFKVNSRRWVLIWHVFLKIHRRRGSWQTRYTLIRSHQLMNYVMYLFYVITSYVRLLGNNRFLYVWNIEQFSTSKSQKSVLRSS